MKVTFFIPEYMIDFRCIGPDCTDTCCSGWDVNIDKTTFNKYENSLGNFKELVKGKYIKNTNSDNPFNYGFMEITDNKKCPFLNSNLLCDIHGKCGEDNLSITCKRYPRVFNIIDGIYEKSGLPSCEEICRIALLNKDKMEFIEFEEDLDEEAVEIRRVIDTETFEGTDSLIQYFWDIRIASISIIQNREFSIEERLLILRSFYARLEYLKENKNFNEIEYLLESISEEGYNFAEHYNCSKVFSYSKTYFKKILNQELYNKLIGNRIKSLVSYLLVNISDDFKKICEHNNTDKLNISLLNYSYIFETYLVNQIFKDIVPFNKGANLNKGINYLINLYKLVKSYILLDCTYSDLDISEKEIIKIIQSLSKDTEHNKVFNDILLN